MTLVPTNALWRYLDNGLVPGGEWIYPWYYDGDWSEGPAELGYGDAIEGRPEATLVEYGPDPDHKPITTYFRHTFEYDRPEELLGLTIRVLRDDGAVIYLNGWEVARTGLPGGFIDPDTPASPPGADGADESRFFEFEVEPYYLLWGDLNVIAVEVHQVAPDSDDLSFALELVARVEDPPPPPGVELVRGPYLQLGTRTSITIRWRTNLPVDSRVRYGLAPDQLTEVVTAPGPTTEHSMRLADLAANTKYYYAIGTSTNQLAGDATHYFVTAPAAPKPVRIWALGDCGTASAGVDGSRQVRDAFYRFAGHREPDVWLMLGDNAYYSGEDHEYQVAVFETYHEMLRRCVLWSTLGNHETYAQLNPYPAIPYFDIFDLPTAGEAGGVPSGTEHYYSFDYANIHFVCLDSEESIRQTGLPMLDWLEQDLAANTNEWTIVFWHSPPYTKGSHNSDSRSDSAGRLFQMRTNVVPILEAHGVDLVLNGHSHSYERSYPLRGHYGLSTTLTPDMVLDSGSGREDDTGPYRKPFGPDGNSGVVYVVAGSSGWATFLTGRHPAMHATLLRMGSMVIDVEGSRLHARFLRETGEIDDEFTLLKNAPPAPFRIARFWSTPWEDAVRWKSQKGKSYRVEECLDLQTPDWQPASLPIRATGATTSWTNQFPASAGQKFFRVVELPD
ncbi:MAG TPA: metallophosphoesterase family protein [Methylomirabilota bacterium]|nr:metallophosphoesterase family protein [Methylomirabilota bacterium]